jgi:hypothetical protein
MCLSLITVTVSATPGDSRASAPELTAGQSDSFTMPSFSGETWYKFNLSAASKVVITLSIESHGVNDFARIVGVYHGIDGSNQMPAYVGITGAPLAERTHERSFPVGLEPEDVPSRTGTYYLAAGWCYINVDWRDMSAEHPRVTIRMDSIDPVSNTGGLTKATATSVNPANDVIMHSRFEHDDWEIGHFYYEFTLSEPAEVSIEKSVELVPSNDERVMMRSSLWLNNSPNELEGIRGKIDGEDVERLEIWEKRDNPLTQTITYTLQAGTYYVVLYNAWAFPGTEYTLTFSMPGATDPQPGGAPNLDSADG